MGGSFDPNAMNGFGASGGGFGMSGTGGSSSSGGTFDPNQMTGKK